MSANSGSAALEALKRAAETGNPCSLILLDVQMPGMDGFTVTQSIKADSQSSAVDIVLLTSVIGKGDADRCHDLGVAACLTKPVGEMELLDALRKISQPAPAAAVRYDRRPGVAIESGLRLNLLVVEDNPVNRVVATRLLNKQNHTVRTASNGREALEIIENEKFDCVLMDVQMPVLDGFETTAAIRARQGARIRPPSPDRRYDRPRDGGRPRTLSSCRNGWLPDQAHQGRGCIRDDRACVTDLATRLKRACQMPAYQA